MTTSRGDMIPAHDEIPSHDRSSSDTPDPGRPVVTGAIESIHQEECLTPCERHDGRHAVKLRSCLECDGHGQEYIGGTWYYCIRCDGAGYDCYGPESYTTNKTVIYGQ